MTDADASTDASRPDRLVVAVLVVDIVGSTDLRRRVGEAAATTLQGVCDRTMLAHVANRDGRTIRRTGDGVVAAFRTVTAATDAMHAIAGALTSVDLDGSTLTVPIRAVVDVGDVDWTDERPRGDVIDRAERIIDALDGTERLLTTTAAAMTTSTDTLVPGPLDGTLMLPADGPAPPNRDAASQSS